MKMKKLLATALCVCLMTGVALFAGCQGGESEASDPGQDSNGIETVDGDLVTLYYANEEYVALGDETLPALLAYETTIKASKDKIYKAALDELLELPEEGYATFLSSLMIKEVTVDGATAIVDFDGHELEEEGGSSMMETFIIDQIVMTLVSSFEEIDSVQLEVDGQEVESLMGHIIISGPLTMEEAEGGRPVVVPVS